MLFRLANIKVANVIVTGLEGDPRNGRNLSKEAYCVLFEEDGVIKVLVNIHVREADTTMKDDSVDMFDNGVVVEEAVFLTLNVPVSSDVTVADD